MNDQDKNEHNLVSGFEIVRSSLLTWVQSDETANLIKNYPSNCHGPGYTMQFLQSSPEDEQSLLYETSRRHRLFSVPTLPQRRFNTWPSVQYSWNVNALSHDAIFAVFSWRRAEFTVRNVETTPVVFSADTPTKENLIHELSDIHEM